MSQVKVERVPPLLKNILEIDKMLTGEVVSFANRFLPFRSIRIHYKLLEISCHGIPWFAFWIAFTWLFDKPSLVQMQANMLLGLFLDIVLIAVAKAYFRRRRPISNKDDAMGDIGPDVFSFPSGHASRSVLVAYFFINLYSVPILFIPPILAWTTCVCLSRLLMRRHYILDIVGGIFLGLFEGWILGLIWLEDSSAKYFMSFLSDEKLDGGEYHVR